MIFKCLPAPAKDSGKFWGIKDAVYNSLLHAAIAAALCLNKDGHNVLLFSLALCK